MKNIIVLLLLFSISLVTDAQNNATYDALVNYDQTYHYYTGQTADTLGVADTVWMYTYWKQSDAIFANYTQIKLDSISGTADTVSVLYQSRINKYADWVTDSTAYWSGSSSDTTFTYNNTTNRAQPYRRIKLLDQSSAFKVKVNSLRQLFQK